MNRRHALAFMAAASTAYPAQTAPGGNITGSSHGPRIFNVMAFGASGKGSTLDTGAINRAIDACHAAGGGLVYLPPGVYLSGTVVLKSNVTLYLEAGSTLLGSTKVGDYQRQPGITHQGDVNQWHLIFARGAENIGLSGPGRIDGQGPAFWIPSGRKTPPPEESWRDVAIYDWKPITDADKVQQRPSPLIELVRCTNVRIDDIRIENAPGWTLRPLECDNVFIRGITIKNPIHGPNSDGIDPTGCRNVLISDCVIEVADDAICLKSESPYGGEVRVTKNVVITNCVVSGCCNGLKFGTATFGGFENVTFTNSVIYNERVDPKARIISGIALEMVDGGWLEGVTISNIRMQNVRTPIFIRRALRRSRPDGSAGTLRGVMIENLHATGSILTNSITGLPGYHVEDVTLSNVRLDSEEGGKEEWVNREIPELPNGYPEARIFGRLPSYGLYCRHVSGLRLKGVQFGAVPAERRPAIVCDDVRHLEIEGLRSASVESAQPVVKLIQTRNAFVRGCTAPAGAATFLEVHGADSGGITMAGNDLTGAKTPVLAKSSAAPEGVVLAGNADRQQV